MTTVKIYTPVWHKYRPVILKLMMNATEGPQQYKLSSHEFKALNPREKGGYSFTLSVLDGKATNNIKTSIVAQDLLSILQESPKATELMTGVTYEVSMDKQFTLQVSRLN